MLLFQTAFASTLDCKTKDLSNSPGFVEKNQIKQTQIGMGWCTAYLMANLVSQKVQFPVSTYDLAFRYNREFKTQDDDLDGANFENFKALLGKINYLCEEKNYGEVYVGYGNKFSIPSIAQSYKEKECQSLMMEAQFFKNISQLSDLAEPATNSDNIHEYFARINEKNCVNKVPIKLDLDIRPEPDMSFIADKINEQKFVGFAFVQQDLFKSDLSLSENSKKLGNHVATIIGKEVINGKCFFKIADSAIESSKSCNRNKASEDIICEGFYYKVPVELLEKSIKKTVIISD